MGSKVLFDNRHAVYKSKNAARTVVLVTFNQLQARQTEGSVLENHHRRSAGNSPVRSHQAGRILKSFEVRFREIYTEVPSSSHRNRCVQPASDCQIQ
jgi:hypothetical protein